MIQAAPQPFETAPSGGATHAPGTQRLDRWLWFARVVKSRSLAAALVSSGKVRANAVKIEKPAQAVRAGDVLTIVVARRVRILKVLACGTRRGPASEAAALYEDLTPEETPPPPGGLAGTPHPAAGRGRPTKKERRAMDRLSGGGEGD